MELYNSTLYNYQAIINGVSYDLKSRSSIFFDCENNASVELKCLNKSFVHIDWISVITMHMLFGSSTITGIYANLHSISIKIKLTYLSKVNILQDNPRQTILQTLLLITLFNYIFVGL